MYKTYPQYNDASAGGVIWLDDLSTDDTWNSIFSGTTPPPPPGDTTVPSVAITGPTNGATVSSTFTVSATASDNVGVAGVQFKLDGQNLGAEDTSSPYSVSWNTTSVPNGLHALTATARDAAGNTTTSSSVSITVNNVTQSFDFSISNGGSKSVTAGSPVTNTINATLVSGNTQSVSFSASGLPTGATASFSGVSCSPACSSTLTINAGATTPAGNSTITATGTGGGVTRTTTFSLTVSAPSSPPPSSSPITSECTNPQPGWIWCDDFEANRLSSYFEYDNSGGDFVPMSGLGVNSSTGMRVIYHPGQSSAGGMKVAFGTTRDPYFKAVDAGTAKYREIYWRMYVKNQAGWTGGGADKLSRATIFAGSNWSQAAIGHVWSGASPGPDQDYLILDPASGTDAAGNLKTTAYNDFANLRWLGATEETTPLFNSANVGQWHCVEARMKLNTAGQSDAVFELWVDGNLDARKSGFNWVGSYNTYGINAVFFENYWNEMSPVTQARYLDNIVVSTMPIGCGTSTASITPPVAPGGLTIIP